MKTIKVFVELMIDETDMYELDSDIAEDVGIAINNGLAGLGCTEWTKVTVIEVE